MEMPAKVDESLIFLDIRAISNYERALIGKQAIINPVTAGLRYFIYAEDRLLAINPE
jgi:hypothetical protein